MYENVTQQNTDPYCVWENQSQLHQDGQDTVPNLAKDIKPSHIKLLLLIPTVFRKESAYWPPLITSDKEARDFNTTI